MRLNSPTVATEERVSHLVSRQWTKVAPLLAYGHPWLNDPSDVAAFHWRA